MKLYLYVCALVLTFMHTNLLPDNLTTALELSLFATKQAKLQPPKPAPSEPAINLDSLSYEELKDAYKNNVPGAAQKINELMQKHDAQIVQANEKTHNASWYSRISLENRTPLEELKRKLKIARDAGNTSDAVKYNKEIESRHEKIVEALKKASADKTKNITSEQARIDAADQKIMQATKSSQTIADLRTQYLEAKNAGASVAVTIPLAREVEERLAAIKATLGVK